ncbi:MAG TPA: 1-deoxy-D-xylulose-5-phosphate reductoisomerase [Xanthobacteraceae bacterium]|nr:1-deoxy-D-xylulose-5-phosphate reductoisomerase [Xanthobacteraceae bacterium]
MQLGLPSRADFVPSPVPRRVTILGATGSIGASTVDLLQRAPGHYRVEAVTANRNAAGLAAIARGLRASFAAVADPTRYHELKAALANTDIEAGAGPDAIVEAAARPADWVMAAITGASGLAPTLRALAQGRTIALANKECLVSAGALFMRRAGAANATVLPVDSEHNALFQALAGARRSDVRRLILTASGGPFRTWSRDQLRDATPEQALRHPNYTMGAKISVDSATLMNKGLELIEAHHLFGLPPAQLAVLVHPQQAVHGLVEFCDGSMIAALAAPDMRIPIAHCLAWPIRLDVPVPRLDLAAMGTLTFGEPDTGRFPALALARAALEMGQGAPTVLNAANEVAVTEFLARRLTFPGISALVEATIEAAVGRGLAGEPATLEDAVALDQAGRDLALRLLPEIAAKAS